jgi:crossover junction endodeoxyribonuclease RuvC
LRDIHDMPMLCGAPAGRRGVDAPRLSMIVAGTHAAKAYVGRVSAWPDESPLNAFAFGRRRGVVEGVCAALCIPISYVAPPVWRFKFGIPPGPSGRDPARAEAARRWPAHAALFARVCDNARAGAALIGLAGLMEEAEQ